MAVNKKLPECTELTTAPAADDLVYIVDVDDTSDDPTGTSKYQQWLNTIKHLFASRFAADAGSTDTYVAALVPAPAAYETGQHYRFKANTANTGACTIHFNGLGAKTIKKAAGGITTDLDNNDIRAGQWVDVVYDGTNMQMQSLLGNVPSGTTPSAHAASHQNGGLDEIDVTGLSGALADPQVPITENVQDIVGAMVVAGTNVTVTYNDGAGTLTIDSTGDGSIAPLVVEGANEIAQRNSTNNQNYEVYGSYTSSSNYQRIRIGWVSGVPQIFSESATAGAVNLIIRASNTSTDGWNLGSGSMVPVTTLGMSIGSGSNYVNEIYNNSYVVKSGGNLRYAGGARLLSPASGIFNIIDDNGNSGSGTIRFDNRTPSTITSDQNNYSVPVTAYFVRLATDASRTLTGLTFGGGGVGDGQVHLLVNVGSNDLVLAHESASSSAANRFTNSTGANITLSAKQAADLIYDGPTSRWLAFKRN